MKRVYYRYEVWEDFQHGMYENDISQDFIDSAIKLLSNQELLFFAMSRAVNEWKKSSEMNLSNRSRNRQAWCGQAACSLMYGVPEQCTKIAWKSLSQEVRDKANATADMVIAEWELSYLSKKKVLNTK